MNLKTETPAHDAPETPRIIVEPVALTGKGAGAAYDWRSEPPGEPTEREKKSPGAGGAEGSGSEGNQFAPIVAQSAGFVKPRTRREIILSALDAMGELIEDEGTLFFVVYGDRLEVRVSKTLDSIAARNGAEIVAEPRVTPRKDEAYPFKRSAVVNGATFYQIMSAKEAARYGIL